MEYGFNQLCFCGNAHGKYGIYFLFCQYHLMHDKQTVFIFVGIWYIIISLNYQTKYGVNDISALLASHCQIASIRELKW